MNPGIRSSRPDEVDRLVEIWRRAVDATHHFLTPADRLAIEAEVRAFFPRGQVCRRLRQSAISEHDVITTDVNEANTQALAFYERMGFQTVGRSDRDGQARPYPLLHLRR